jgi:hypothetical protein
LWRLPVLVDLVADRFHVRSDDLLHHVVQFVDEFVP